MNRNAEIVKTSFIGIAVNVLLAGFKFVVGLVANSIAITLDAVNNLSDALSSVITIIGAKLASKRPDKQHPFGHGRVEYLSAAIIAVIVLYAGVTAMIESVKKIITPEIPDYSTVTLVIVAVAVAVKFLLGGFFIGKGKKIASESLIMSGKDARLDSLVSLATLVAALVFTIWGFGVEAYLGVLISLLMIRSGVDMLRETLSHILGERPDSKMALSVKEVVNSFPEVSGAYDLVLHNYGPDMLTGSVHIEVPENLKMAELDRLEREIAEAVLEKCNVFLTGISVYSKNTNDSEKLAMLNRIRRVVMDHDNIIQMHGFYVNFDKKELRFDIVVGFGAENREELYDHVVKDVQEMYPDYNLKVGFDADLSD